MQVPIDPEKRLLVDVASILRRAEEIHGQAEHTLVVSADQLLESVLVAAPGPPELMNQPVDSLGRLPFRLHPEP